MGSSIRDRLEALSTVALTVSAVAIAGAVVYKSFFSPANARESLTAPQPPERVGDWNAILRTGILVGDSAAPVKVAEFADLECPACRLFHSRLREIRQTYGGKVAFVFLHYPLQQHRFARPAARAAECANDQGRFAEFIDIIYEKQDSLGLKTWDSFAAAARIPNSARFMKCVADTTTVTRIEEGLSLGSRVGVRATPTIIVNGWRLWTTPMARELSSAVDSVIAGKEPFPGRK